MRDPRSVTFQLFVYRCHDVSVSPHSFTPSERNLRKETLDIFILHNCQIFHVSIIHIGVTMYLSLSPLFTPTERNLHKKELLIFFYIIVKFSRLLLSAWNLYKIQSHTQLLSKYILSHSVVYQYMDGQKVLHKISVQSYAHTNEIQIIYIYRSIVKVVLLSAAQFHIRVGPPSPPPALSLNVKRRGRTSASSDAKLTNVFTSDIHPHSSAIALIL